MVKDLAFHTELQGSLLDEYLERGWYRLGQLVFTTDYIPAFELALQEHNGKGRYADTIYKEALQVLPASDIYYRVFWLRFRLEHFVFGKKQQKLISKNKAFTTSLTRFQNNPEFESLYSLYKKKLPFDISPTLSETLYGNPEDEELVKDIFDTWVISIREDGRLIAAGIFDKGKNSMAGIINIINPFYDKYSLGKYLMLLKIRHAMETGMDYYYPGYISPDYDKFDYKLFPGLAFAELYDSQAGSWNLYKGKD